MTEEHSKALLERHVAALREHFDAVQIFVSRFDGEKNETMVLHEGHGNYCARTGQVKDWLDEELALTQYKIIEAQEQMDADE